METKLETTVLLDDTSWLRKQAPMCRPFALELMAAL